MAKPQEKRTAEQWRSAEEWHGYSLAQYTDDRRDPWVVIEHGFGLEVKRCKTKRAARRAKRRFIRREEKEDSNDLVTTGRVSWQGVDGDG